MFGPKKAEGYVTQGFRIKLSLYRKLLTKLHRREEPKGFSGWLEKQMLKEIDDLDWLEETSKTHTGGQE